MALMTNSCETGIASGTAVSNANNDDGGAGDTFALSPSGTSALVFSSVQKAHGSLSHLFTVASGASVYEQWTVTAGGSVTARFYVYFTNTPSTSAPIFSARSSSAQRAAVLYGSDGVLKIIDGASANKTTGWSALSLNTWYRIEVVVTKGTTSSDGRIQVKYFTLDSTSAIGTYDTVSAGHTADTGTADFTQVRFGRPSGVTTSADMVFYMDDFAAQDSASFLGPVGTNLAPTVTPVQSTYTFVKNASGTFAWNEADSDGTVASRVVTRVSGPGSAPTLSSPTTTSRSATWATQGIHVYEIVATDDDGADSAPATITVVVTDTSARPSAVASNTGPWTNEGGAASIEAALADESDTTLAQTPDNPSGAALTVTFDPVGLGLVTVKTLDRASASSPTITRTVSLMQGATVIATGTPFTLTTTAVNHEFTTTISEAAAITDRSALRIRATDTV